MIPPSAPTFFYDYLTGADGSLNGHTPDTPYGDRVWVTSDVNIASNAIVSSDQSSPEVFGTATYGTPNVSFGGPLYATFKVQFTTPSVFVPSTFHKGIELTFNSGGQNFVVKLRRLVSNVWSLLVDSDLAVAEDSVDVTLTTSTFYTLVCKVGSQAGSEDLLASVRDAIDDEVGSIRPVIGSISGIVNESAHNLFGLSSISLSVGAGFLLDEPQVTGEINSVYTAFGLPSLQFDSDTSFHGSSEVTLPAIAASSLGGGLAQLTLPSLSAFSAGHDSTGDRAADITLPSLTASAQSGANATLTLPKLDSQAAGTTTLWGEASIGLPSLTGQASGQVSAMASAALTLPAMSGVSYSGALCSVTIGSITSQATGTTGSVGGAQITLPLFQATATATAGSYGYAHLTLPSLGLHSGGNDAAVSLPSLQLTVIGSAVVTATYEAYAVNLKHTPRGNEQPTDEVTHYTNFPFTHVVRYQNSYYGANSTGLYLLEGTTDDTTPIPWAVKTAMTDFKSPTKKTLASAYFAGRFGPASTIKLHAGEQTPNSHSFSTPRGALAQNHRQVFGKGVKERYYALEASGTGVCELDSIELDVHNLTRRI